VGPRWSGGGAGRVAGSTTKFGLREREVRSRCRVVSCRVVSANRSSPDDRIAGLPFQNTPERPTAAAGGRTVVGRENDSVAFPSGVDTGDRNVAERSRHERRPRGKSDRQRDARSPPGADSRRSSGAAPSAGRLRADAEDVQHSASVGHRRVLSEKQERDVMRDASTRWATFPPRVWS
jgi:hypothetical protein